MNSSVTKLILSRNNQNQIEKTLKSISGDIIVGDMESSDNTKIIVSKQKCKLINLPWNNSYSEGWNKLLEIASGFVLCLNPGEILLDFEEEFDENEIYSIGIVNGDWLSYQTRLWNTNKKIKFKNRIFEETIPYTQKSQLMVLNESIRNSKETSKLLDLWEKEEKNNNKITYYRSLFHLSVGEIKKFKSLAEEYLFKCKQTDDNTILIWFYLAFAEMNLGNYQKSTEWISCVLSEKPWMAEAWCMSAETAVKMNQHGRAFMLYKMAIASGKWRPNSDKMPIDIGKYFEQPNDYIKKFESSWNSYNDSNI